MANRPAYLRSSPGGKIHAVPTPADDPNPLGHCHIAKRRALCGRMVKPHHLPFSPNVHGVCKSCVAALPAPAERTYCVHTTALGYRAFRGHTFVTASSPEEAAAKARADGLKVVRVLTVPQPKGT